MPDRPHVLVVGAGIVGASIAWHLARAGARVIVVEAGAPGGVATRNSWAWINATWGNPEPYFRLRVRSMEEWRALERDVPGLGVSWVGGLTWNLPPEELRAFAARHSAWGYDLRLVDRAEALGIEPCLAEPAELAVHAPGEGAIEPLAATTALVDAARGLGATVTAQTPVRSLAFSGDRVIGVETDAGRIEADEVVVASGVGVPALVAPLGIAVPLVEAPAVLVRTEPCGRLLNGLVIAPGMELRQMADGYLLAVGSLDGAGPETAAAELFERIGQTVRSESELAFASHTIAHRPMPADGFPIVGRAPGLAGLYVAVTHSGVTLAPAIGRFAAEEILAGERDRLLDPYGLRRFAG